MILSVLPATFLWKYGSCALFNFTGSAKIRAIRDYTSKKYVYSKVYSRFALPDVIGLFSIFRTKKLRSSSTLITVKTVIDKNKAIRQSSHKKNRLLYETGFFKRDTEPSYLLISSRMRERMEAATSLPPMPNERPNARARAATMPVSRV